MSGGLLRDIYSSVPDCVLPSWLAINMGDVRESKIGQLKSPAFGGQDIFGLMSR